jgi:hypothetical protein
MRKVDYQCSLVTYLDILGFRELIESRSAGYISRTLRLVKHAIQPESRDAKEYGLQYQSFSDLIVITVPLTNRSNLVYRPGALFSQLLALLHAQTSLLGEGILLRGAITVGDVEKSYGLLYGPALVKAYELEQKRAKYSRIIVDSEVVRQLKTNPALRRHDYKYEKKAIDAVLSRDADGELFIDYVRAIETEFDFPEEAYPLFLLQHRKLIKNGLARYRKNERIRAKYEWLQKYHNRTLESRYGLSGGEGFQV